MTKPRTEPFYTTPLSLPEGRPGRKTAEHDAGRQGVAVPSAGGQQGPGAEQ